MKSIFSNFLYVLKRFKTSSVLNLIGLSAAFAVFTVVFIQVNYDFGYDRQFEKADQLYFLSMENSIVGRGITMPTTMAKEMQSKFPEVKGYCLLNTNLPDKLEVDVIGASGVRQKLTTRVVPATPGIMQLFSPKIIQGSANGVFTEPGKGLITESEAHKLFGDVDPIGKTLYYHDRKDIYNNQSTDHITIQAVCRDFPKNCSLENGIYTQLPDDRPENYNYSGYFCVDPKEVNVLLGKLNSAAFFGKADWAEMKKDPARKVFMPLTSLNKAHFDQEAGRMTTTLSLLFIGILTLIIAYINFLNFSVAISPVRIKTLNIHKIIGADVGQLKWMLASEAALFSVVAFALSLVYVYLLRDSFLGEYFSADLRLSPNWLILFAIACAAVVFGLLFGWFAARRMVSFQPAVALNGSLTLSHKGPGVRNLLIGLQFTAALTLIIVAMFIQLQNSYMQKKSWGIQKENIVYLPYGKLRINMNTFGDELKKDPRILDYTAAQFTPGHVGMAWGRGFEGKPVNATIWPVHTNFLHFFGVKVMQGCDFQPTDSVGTKRAIIFNEAFVRKYQFDNRIIGKDFSGFDQQLTIRGIAKNVNYSSLRDTISPMGFVVLKESFMNWFFIKLSGNDVPGAIQFINKSWNKYSDEEFDLNFLNQSMDKLYKNETNLAKLISLFGLIAVLIAVMGVYGLIVFNTRHRAKEIAIRKVNGSTVSEIMLMLNRRILWLLLLAYAVSVPLSYAVLKHWLAQFAYRTPVYAWVFVLAGLLVLCVTVLAVSVQSYRAATANPVEALKRE